MSYVYDKLMSTAGCSATLAGGSTERMQDMEALEYLSDMSRQMSVIATRSGYPSIGDVLEYAATEAVSAINRGKQFGLH